MAKKLVDPTRPFRAVYAVYEHEYLGVLMSAHAVQENDAGKATLVHQGLYKENMKQFAHRLDERDKAIITLLGEVHPKAIFKKFGGKAKDERQFFHEKFSDEIKAQIQLYITRRVAEAVPMTIGKQVGIMGNDGYPVYKPVEVLTDKATILFHFRRNEEGTRYYPTIKLRGEKIEFMYQDAVIVCRDPAWMLLHGEMFTFEKKIDGKKLRPFLQKRFIAIPKASEKQYYEKFVTPLLERYDVYAQGFGVQTVAEKPAFSLVINANGGNSLSLGLQVQYGDFEIPVNERQKVKAVMEQTGEDIKFFRIRRDEIAETEFRDYIDSLGGKDDLLNWEYIDKQSALDWLARHVPELEARNIQIIQKNDDRKLNFDQPKVLMETAEVGDWFDIRAVVEIGEFRIPFVKFRRHILKGLREFDLPDGTIAILPESWFTEYRHLVEVAEEGVDGRLQIKIYHAGLIPDSGSPKGSFMDRLRRINEVGNVPETTVSKGVHAELRTYQAKGLDWLEFLKNHNVGGILADDMGLGKTLQTLALLMREKDNGVSIPSLIVMPTSLLYNWKEEAKRFTPTLNVRVHSGIKRFREPEKLMDYDVILTTYGLARQDSDLFNQIGFHYIILDESQMIKNPGSKTNQAVRKLHGKHRLSLTGTPVENTLMDLWSQMTFLNPGLLGSEKFFRDFYMIPIEKEGDEKRRMNLKAVLNPFILRRTKEQVASELPPKIEQIRYCEMEPDQEELYEEVRNSYRNYLLNLQGEKDFAQKRFNILAGLQQLRQISIHPNILTEREGYESGKYLEFRRMLEDILEEKSKVLIFSQFVRFLDLVKADLEENDIPYCMLTGSTNDRDAEVVRFQTDPDVPVFLISLKAGGVGLNLTAAEYVFILDPWWNPAVENQAMDRTHRIGQEKTVFVYKFITRGTIEEKILQLQAKKARLSADVIQVEEDVFKQLGQEDILGMLQ